MKRLLIILVLTFILCLLIAVPAMAAGKPPARIITGEVIIISPDPTTLRVEYFLALPKQCIEKSPVIFPYETDITEPTVTPTINP